jgi:hypothetical protein
METLRSFDPNTMLLYRESTFEYREINWNNENLCLDGYFQSYKYFEKHYHEIKQRIGLLEKRESVQNKYKEHYFMLFDRYVGYHTISIHFRLGDYKNVQYNHCILTRDYYLRALAYMLTETQEKIVVVFYFCEEADNEEVKETIVYMNSIYPSVTFIKIDDRIPDYEQLLLMSCCKDNIIANSTFSWWGAYFNEYTKKRVCYPSTWFGPRLAMTHDTRDLFPDTWIKI